ALGLVAALLAVGAALGREVATALATLRARALTPALHRRLAGWVRPRTYSDAEFFRADGTGEAWTSRRRQGLERLAASLRAAQPPSRGGAAAGGPTLFRSRL